MSSPINTTNATASIIVPGPGPDPEISSFPPTHIIPPSSGTHTHTAIILHGHSWTATTFATRLLALRPSSGTSDTCADRNHDASISSLSALFPTLRLVFPAARVLHSHRLDAQVSSWFEAASYRDMRVGQALQTPGLAASVRHVLAIVDEEAALLGGDAARVVLGGWSQGAAAGLWTLLCGAAVRRDRNGLGGFFGIGPWMSFVDEVHEIVMGAEDGDGEEGNAERNVIKGVGFMKERIELPGEIDAGAAKRLAATPVLLGHGTDDEIVPVTLGRKIRNVLQKMGMTVEWREYTGAPDQGHWVKEPEQFDCIIKFLKSFVERAAKPEIGSIPLSV